MRDFVGTSTEKLKENYEISIQNSMYDKIVTSLKTLSRNLLEKLKEKSQGDGCNLFVGH